MRIGILVSIAALLMSAQGVHASSDVGMGFLDSNVEQAYFTLVTASCTERGGLPYGIDSMVPAYEADFDLDEEAPTIPEVQGNSARGYAIIMSGYGIEVEGEHAESGEGRWTIEVKPQGLLEDIDLNCIQDALNP